MNTPENIAMQGIALAVLQAYPLGTLRVRTPDGDGTVIGFMYNRVSERYCPVVDLDISSDKIGMGYSVVDCLPYLLPFSALTEQLPDGTIPAVEVAKLFNDYPQTLVDWKNAEIWQTGDTGEFYVAANHLARNGYIKMSIWPDWSFIGQRDKTRQALDYLRRNHFAVGLESHQYIAKSSAAVPTIEKTEAHG